MFTQSGRLLAALPHFCPTAQRMRMRSAPGYVLNTCVLIGCLGLLAFDVQTANRWTVTPRHQFRRPANDGRSLRFSGAREDRHGSQGPTQQRRISLGGCALAATKACPKDRRPVPAEPDTWALRPLRGHRPAQHCRLGLRPESLVSDCLHNRLSGVPHPCPASWRRSASVTERSAWLSKERRDDGGRHARRLPVRFGHRPSATRSPRSPLRKQAKEAARRRGREAI